MSITDDTFKVYLHAIYVKFKIDNRTELALMAELEGVLMWPAPRPENG